MMAGIELILQAQPLALDHALNRFGMGHSRYVRAYELQGHKVKLSVQMREVVGRALDTRTPIFLDEMRFIEFSPYWNVP